MEDMFGKIVQILPNAEYTPEYSAECTCEIQGLCMKKEHFESKMEMFAQILKENKCQNK